jgi:hypothetical protein
VPALSTELRKRLESGIREARGVAEAGARRALEALGVDRHEPHGSMSPAERALRTRLRAHGRQLGDARDRTRGTQEIQHLAHEVAYEHWHRMLFARFLAENQLLIEPESGVAISMAECEELARERGEDPWAFAGRAAARMLPRIFRPDDPALEVALAPETRQALERLLTTLPAAVFTADDSLGWTYQFWQAERKDEVNRSGVKIGADELPAVTQLFTEHYMVQFLLHNTIGAWRAGKILAERPEVAENAASEDELRRAVRLEAQGAYDFSYLRFVREAREGDEEGRPTGDWRPAAGTFETWPRGAAELRLLDPCCGSGHFLVEGLELLVRLRMEEEGLALEDAIRAALAENLYGLEIDPRCTQIAAFALALAAWKLAGKPIGLPPLQIACAGLAIGSTKKEWLDLASDDAKLRGGMERLYDLFEKAPELGSLIDPRSLTRDPSTADLFVAEFKDLEPLLAAALGRERRDEERVERAVAAQDMARAAELLAGTYTLVITNVPYLGRGNQTNVLKAFAEEHHKEAKADLATIFISRIFRWLGAHGTQAVVTPQNWLFLTSYKKLREKLLSLRTWNLVARLGPGAFETIGGHVVNVALCVLSAGKPEPDWQMAGIDVSAPRGSQPVHAREKAALLRGEPAEIVLQAGQIENPDARILFASNESSRFLASQCRSFLGLGTGDLAKYERCFWEFAERRDGWAWFQGPVDETRLWDGCECVVAWDHESNRVRGMSKEERDQIHNQDQSGQQAWGRRGVSVSLMGTLRASFYTGERYDKATAVLVPTTGELLPALWCFCRSPEFNTAVREVDRNVMCSNGALVKVPFDVAHWQKVAAEKYPNGLPEPQSDDPTQWLFHGHLAKAEPHAALQVAVARLLGYRWPPEHDPGMRLAAEARAWVTRCRDLDSFADKDGIVCLGATRGEAGAADRLRRLLAVGFGSAWSAAKERELLAAAAAGSAPAGSLEEWLRDRFFEEHCKLFHHRPFVWHVWDGRRDGFHALVSYHRLAGPKGEGRRTLEALTYSYLGDWIERQKAEQREAKGGADARLAAALDLQAQLARILEGEPPCDLFVRWKPLGCQAIGWEPDLEDGVRLNIRPFLLAELRSGGRKGAGLLRWKPNVNWSKDRGQEPQSLRPKEEFPWFWGCPADGTLGARIDLPGGPEFDGNRWNDLHYTSAAKRAARDRAGGGGRGDA